MNYLNRLLTFFQNIFQRGDNLSSIIDNGETISRFITCDTQFNKNTKRPRKNLFQPPRDKKLSVYRVKNYTEKKIWWLADKFVTALRTDRRLVLGRADLPASSYLEVKLEFDADGKPHKRHVNVIGWPNDKLRCNEIALFLAENCNNLILRSHNAPAKQGA